MFAAAIGVMAKTRIRTEAEIAQFRSIQERVEEIKQAAATAAEDFGEVPDEFRGTKSLSTYFSPDFYKNAFRNVLIRQNHSCQNVVKVFLHSSEVIDYSIH